MNLRSPLRLLISGLLLSSATVIAAAQETPAGKPAVTLAPGEGQLDVLVAGQPRLRLMVARDTSTPERAHETYKPYAHVLGPDGQPITKGPGGFYTHHRGIFFGAMRLRHGQETFDFWGMGKNVQLHQKFLRQEVGDDGAAQIAQQIDWVTADGRTLVEETRETTVYPADDVWLLADFRVMVRAAGGEVTLGGDPEHGGFQYRPSNVVADEKSAQYIFHADAIDPRRDRDMPWVALVYPLAGRTWTVQMMNHRENPEGTIWSAYRDYGRFGCYVPDVRLGPGDAWTARYRLRITQGAPPSREALSEAYAAWAASP